MKADAKPLKKLLPGTDRYVVPLYQRPYVWVYDSDDPEKDRLGPYWTDVKETADAYMERSRLVAQAGGDESKIAPMTPHFFGAVVIDQPVKEGEITTQEVIDGQQRLTTTLLLLAAATRMCESRGMPKHASRLRRLWQQDDDLELTGLARFKLSPTRQDQDAFLAVMEGNAILSTKQSKVTDAYSYFVRQLDEWAEDIPVGKGETYFDALRETLYEHLLLVDIRLEDGDNAQGIFESLNAQGEKLLAMDLVKNEVFRRAKRPGTGIDLDVLDRDVWSPRFSDPWWRTSVRQGRYTRPRAELFLMHWLIDQKGRDISATALYIEFQAIARKEMEAPSSFKGFLDRFMADADRYRSLDSLTSGSPEQRFFSRLAVVDTAVVYPLILRLWRWADEGRIPRSGLLGALAALESYLIRRFVVVSNAGKNYNNVVVGILRAIGTSAEPVADPIRALIGYLQESDDKTRSWPTDEAFASQLSTQKFYQAYSRRRDEFLLSVVEDRLRKASAKTEQGAVPIGLTIEHVIPQSWEEFWPLPDLGDEDDEESNAKAQSRRREHLHRLGNLSLVTGSLNPALGKEPWASKKLQLLQFSTLQLNADLVTNPAYTDRFDEDSIDERGKRLAGLLVQEWPGPYSAFWSAF
jgi:uncharacterized protein with ParB-like and HNH nuclease domain